MPALAVLMIVAATTLAGAHDEVAGLLIGLGIVTLASVTLIEPATTRAAGIECDHANCLGQLLTRIPAAEQDRRCGLDG